LVHCTNNRQEIDFLCNCCSCHCVILKSAKAQPKPGLAVNSGFQPNLNADLCESCEICMERCPMSAIQMDKSNYPTINLDRCIGCGLCATGCPTEAIMMNERVGIPAPSLNRKELNQAIQDSLSSLAGQGEIMNPGGESFVFLAGRRGHLPRLRLRRRSPI
jgi:Pyruvate/2-oxoacid:ferredoxin oxidoreductase delta subunit